MKRKAYVLEPPPSAISSPTGVGDEVRPKMSEKRKVPLTGNSDTTSTLKGIDFKEKSSLLLGQVDEDELTKQVKTVRLEAASKVMAYSPYNL